MNNEFTPELLKIFEGSNDYQGALVQGLFSEQRGRKMFCGFSDS